MAVGRGWSSVPTGKTPFPLVQPYDAADRHRVTRTLENTLAPTFELADNLPGARASDVQGGHSLESLCNRPIS